MNKYGIFLISMVLAFALACAVLYVTLDRHEQAHTVINTYYGAQTNYSLTFSFSALNGQASASVFPTHEDRQLAYLGHSINEAVGYQNQPFIFIVSFLLSAMFFFHAFLELNK